MSIDEDNEKTATQSVPTQLTDMFLIVCVRDLVLVKTQESLLKAAFTAVVQRVKFYTVKHYHPRIIQILNLNDGCKRYQVEIKVRLG